MARTIPRLITATLAYAGGIMILPAAGQAALDAVWDGSRSGWQALGGLTAPAVTAAAGVTADVGTLVATLGPLALLAVAAVLGLIVWPATVDHVPNRLAESSVRDAEVIPLQASQPAPSGDHHRQAA